MYIVISGLARSKLRYEKMSRFNVTVVSRSSETAGDGREAFLYIQSIGPPADHHVSGAPTNKIIRADIGIDVCMYLPAELHVSHGRALPGCSSKKQSNVRYFSGQQRQNKAQAPELMDVRACVRAFVRELFGDLP